METDFQLQTIQSTSALAKEIDLILQVLTRLDDVERALFGACVLRKHLTNPLIEKTKDKLREKYAEVNRPHKYKLLEELSNEGPLNYVALSVLKAERGELQVELIINYYKKFSSLEEFEKTVAKLTASTHQRRLQSALIRSAPCEKRLHLLLEKQALEGAWTEAPTKEAKVNLIDTILNFDTPRPSFAAVLCLISHDFDTEVSSNSMSVQYLAILCHKLGEFIGLHTNLFRNLLDTRDTKEFLCDVITRQKLFRDAIINFLKKYFMTLETVDQEDIWMISEENCDKFPAFVNISIDEVIHFLNTLLRDLTLDTKTILVKEIFDKSLAKSNPALCEYVKYYLINTL